MLDQTLSRAGTSLWALCKAAEADGISAEICLEGTGLNREDVERGEGQVTLAQEVRAIENYVRIAPSAIGLGVGVGRHLHVNAFGIWGFAILTSPTVRSAIMTAVDYAKLSFLIADMALNDEGEVSKLVFETELVPSIIRSYVLERHATVTMTFVRELIQEPGFSDFVIETKSEDEAYAGALSDLLTVPVKPGSGADALVIPSDVLDRPLPKSDPVSLKFCLDQCKALVKQAHGRMPPWSQKVRDAVIEHIDTEQKIDDIAGKLSVTERTLRRRLSEEGASFRDIYIDARMTIARELLEVAGLNVETVSWRVGYSEPASFVRAFSKKFGATPGEVRKTRA